MRSIIIKLYEELSSERYTDKEHFKRVKAKSPKFKKSGLFGCKTSGVQGKCFF